jgi:hypothetical protein
MSRIVRLVWARHAKPGLYVYTKPDSLLYEARLMSRVVTF